MCPYLLREDLTPLAWREVTGAVGEWASKYMMDRQEAVAHGRRQMLVHCIWEVFNLVPWEFR